VHTAYERQGATLTGNILMQVTNNSQKDVGIAIKDMSYKSSTISREIKAGGETSVVMLLKPSRGWYDFMVKADGSDGEARYAGHVETGMPSSSDPLMGGVV